MDRNFGKGQLLGDQVLSLSARRAWIEISAWGQHGTAAGSLSARRAWIEMALAPKQNPTEQVALRKESVDRNINEDVS